jgi:hypothetical protein
LAGDSRKIGRGLGKVGRGLRKVGRGLRKVGRGLRKVGRGLKEEKKKTHRRQCKIFKSLLQRDFAAADYLFKATPPSPLVFVSKQLLKVSAVTEGRVELETMPLNISWS